jgi:hypothetical protein
MLEPQQKTQRLSDPIATCGDRVYVISSQNGLFPDTWGGHVPGEMWGVWNHPIKLLDGFWFAVAEKADSTPAWLLEAQACRAHPGFSEFDYAVGPLRITRQDFVPDGVEGLRVQLRLQATDPALFGRTVTLHAVFRSDLMPAWLGEEAGMVDARDTAVVRQIAERQAGQPITGTAYDPTTLRDAPRTEARTEMRDTVVVFRDAANPWCCVVAASQDPYEFSTGTDVWGPQRTHGRGTGAQLSYKIALDASGTAALSFFVAGSLQSESAALNAAAALREHIDGLMQTKVDGLQATARVSRIDTPDARLNDAAAWSKLITQMFARNVPGYGVAVGAGFPEYPWWFGIDSEYAILPMLQSGQFELVKDTLRLLKRESERCNAGEPGRVIHEMSTVGVVFNKGNMVETPAFTRAVYQTWQWTGDKAFVREMYPFCKAGLLEHALRDNDPDGDLCPNGRSIIETVEMHMGVEVIDVACYTSEALWQLAALARVAGDGAIAPELEAKAAALAERIRSEWWLADEGLFADVRASTAEIRAKLNELERIAAEQDWMLEQHKFLDIARALFEPGFAKHAAKPQDIDVPWLLRHWVVLCPLESGIATPEQARRTLARLNSPEFSNDWGMYLHPNRHDVMSINTGMLALSAARYGDVGLAQQIVDKMVRAFSYRTPGAVCEALPDLWCFIQLWSNLGLVSPVIEGYLGIEPDAATRTLRIAPNLPAGWDRAAVHELRVGDDSIDVLVMRQGSGYEVTVDGTDGWTLVLGGVVTGGDIRVNGTPETGSVQNTLRGRVLSATVKSSGHTVCTVA